MDSKRPIEPRPRLLQCTLVRLVHPGNGEVRARGEAVDSTRIVPELILDEVLRALARREERLGFATNDGRERRVGWGPSAPSTF